MKDSQKSRSYRAEDLVICADLRAGTAALLKTDSALRTFVDEVYDSPWTKRNFPDAHKPNVTVTARRRNSASASSWEGLSFPTYSFANQLCRTKMIVLHEIAHLLVKRWKEEVAPGYRGGHHWAWAAVYVMLVKHFIDASTASRLAASFKEHRVRYTAPRKRRKRAPMNYEQYVASVARMEKARFVREIKREIKYTLSHSSKRDVCLFWFRVAQGKVASHDSYSETQRLWIVETLEKHYNVANAVEVYKSGAERVAIA